MLYTRKGDGGATKAFDTKKGERISKASRRTEALGALDELNSFLGFVKVKATRRFTAGGTPVRDLLHILQENLFIVQAELAGALKTIGEKKVAALETIIDAVERELPPITSFLIPGGTELGALLDVARTIARRAERDVVAALEGREAAVGAHTLAYLNRLSSLLYALARRANHASGIKEEPPTYK